MIFQGPTGRDLKKIQGRFAIFKRSVERYYDETERSTRSKYATDEEKDIRIDEFIRNPGKQESDPGRLAEIQVLGKGCHRQEEVHRLHKQTIPDYILEIGKFG